MTHQLILPNKIEMKSDDKAIFYFDSNLDKSVVGQAIFTLFDQIEPTLSSHLKFPMGISGTNNFIVEPRLTYPKRDSAPHKSRFRDDIGIMVNMHRGITFAPNEIERT